ncbi:MAG: tetratricopeptide repeat protein [Planctomycetota bacterium]
MPISRVKIRRSPPILRRATHLRDAVFSAHAVYAVLLLILISLGASRPSAAEESGEPNMREAVDKIVRMAQSSTDAPDEEFLVCIPSDPSERTRFSAFLARHRLGKDTFPMYDRPFPRITISTDRTIPAWLTVSELRGNGLPQQSYILLIRAHKEDSDDHSLHAGVYRPGGGAPVARETVHYTPGSTAKNLRESRRQPISSSDRDWLNLLSHLFPPYQPDEDSADAVAVHEGLYLFHRSLWELSAERLSSIGSNPPEGIILYLTIALQFADQPDTARNVVDEAIQRRPDNGPLYALKAWLFLRQEAPGDALMLLEQARLSDVAREGLYYLARHLLERERNNSDAARDALEDASGHLSKHPEVQALAASFYWEVGELEKAIDHYQRAIENGADRNQDLWVELGMALHASGQKQEAVEAYREAFQINPTKLSVARQLADMLQSIGRHTDALEVFATAAREETTDPRLHLIWGRAAAELWQTDQAIKAFSRAADNDGPEAMGELCRMHIRKQEFREADELISGIDDRYEDYPQRPILSAELAIARAKFDRAEKILQDAADNAATEAEAHLLLSRIARENGEAKDATHHAQVAVTAHATPAAYTELALAYADRKDYDRAQSALDKALEQFDPTPELLQARIRIHLARDDIEKASEVMEKAVELNPYNPLTHWLAGKISLKRDQPERCAEHWTEAVELNPWDAQMHWELAELLHKKLQRPQKALPHYKEHSDLDGENAPAARERMQSLQDN